MDIYRYFFNINFLISDQNANFPEFCAFPHREWHENLQFDRKLLKFYENNKQKV